jgi:predicted transcriptional regulator
MPYAQTHECIAVWVERSVRDRVDRLAGDRRVSRSIVVREAIDEYLERLGRRIDQDQDAGRVSAQEE